MKIIKDIIVIGGGIIGKCVCMFLSKSGNSIACFDDNKFSGSNTNAGSLHVQLQSRIFRMNPHLVNNMLNNLEFYIDSVDAWVQLSEMLEDDIDLKINGGIMIAESESQLAFLSEKIKKEKEYKLKIEIINEKVIRKEFPFFSNKVIGGAFCEKEGKVNNLIANKQIKNYCSKNGIEFINENVKNIKYRNNQFELRIKNNNDIYLSNYLIIAAGSGSGELAKMLNIEIPTKMEPLQMNVTEKVEQFLPYLVQHAEKSLTLKQISTGNIIIGGGWQAKLEDSENINIIKENFVGNLKVASEIVPCISEINLLRSWGGINTIIDGMSVIGNHESNDKLFFSIPGDAGYTLGPLVAKITADLILKNEINYDIKKLSPMRFLNSFDEMKLN